MSATTDALSTAVDTENAAIFAYGVATAFISPARRPAVNEYIAAHRARRDAMVTAIMAAKQTPPEAAAGYNLPTAVHDPMSAAHALLAAETDCAVAYRAVLEKADDASARKLGLDGLTGVAMAAATWREAVHMAPVTVAFPGSPS